MEYYANTSYAVIGISQTANVISGTRLFAPTAVTELMKTPEGELSVTAGVKGCPTSALDVTWTIRRVGSQGSAKIICQSVVNAIAVQPMVLGALAPAAAAAGRMPAAMNFSPGLGCIAEPLTT